MVRFTPVSGMIRTSGIKKVKAVMVRVIAADFVGEVWATDLQLQSGQAASGWAGHIAELKWSVDE